METIEDVKAFFQGVAEQAARQANWNRGAKLVHVGIAIGLALISLAMVAFSDIDPVAISMIGASSLLAVSMVFWFRRDERKMAAVLAEAECVLAHIESGLPFKVTECSSRVVETVREFGKRDDDNGEGL